MTSSDASTSVNLTEDQINYVIRAILSDVHVICDESFRAAHDLGDGGALERDDSDRHIERLIAHGTEMNQIAQTLQSLQEGRVALRDEDRSARIKKMATRVREAQGGRTDD